MDRFARAVGQLKAVESTSDLPAAVASAALTVGFERAMVSTIDDEFWQPRTVEIDGEADWRSRVEATAQDSPQLIERSVPERHVVEHLAPVFVPPPRDVHIWSKRHWDYRHPRSVTAYVASPLVSDGRVVGIVHADRGRSSSPLSYQDLSLLWSLCGVADIAFAGLLASERLARMGSAPSSRLSPDAAELPSRPERLTPRERDVMALVAEGLGNREIARAMVLSEGTVKSHIKHVLAKTGHPNRTAAALWWAGR